MAVTRKPGVVLEPRTPTLDFLIGVIQKASQFYACEFVITAGRDSHDDTDPHTRGLAIDVRMSPLSDDKILDIVKWLRAAFPACIYLQYETRTNPIDKSLALYPFTVVTNAATGKHIHIQLRKGLHELPVDVAETVPSSPVVAVAAA